MAVNGLGIGSVGTGPASDAKTGSNALGKDEFVKLLMAQLGNQDPVSPVDSQAFVAQLAQFANVELLQSANSQLDSILMAEAAGNQTSVVGLVGKEALFRTDSVELRAGESAPICAELSDKAESMTVVITDASGKTVRTLRLGAQSAGVAEASWDGLDDAGTRLPPGTYKVQVTAADAEGKSIDVAPRARARINGVSFDNGVPELLIGSIRIQLSDVVEVREPVL